MTTPTKSMPAKKTTAKKTAPAAPAETPRPAPTTGDAEARIADLEAQLAAARAGDVAAPEGTPPGPGAGDTGALSRSYSAGDDTKNPGSSLKVGSVARLAPDDDNPDAPAVHVLVVGEIEGTEHRDAGALVVALPDARYMPTSALVTD